MGKFFGMLIVCAALAVSGCSRSTSALNVNTQAPPQPLPSSPSGDIQTGQLDPISNQPIPPGAENPLNPEAPTIGGDVQPSGDSLETASLQPQNGQPLTHESLAGAWNVVSDSPDCRVFLSFTKWSGGYRAGSRRCLSGELASVSAWDVRGSQVVLVDSNGTQIAALSSTGTESYSGTTSSGKPVSFSR